MLDASLDAVEGDDGLDLALTVSNDGDEPLTLRFRSGQRAEFAAYRSDEADEACEAAETGESGDSGETDTADPVWRHGAGMMFTQVLGSETLEAGESATYEATWPDPPAGTYRIVGTLTAEEPGVEAAATVELD